MEEPPSVFSQAANVRNVLPNGDVHTNYRLRKAQVDNYVDLQQTFAQHHRVLADMCTGSGKSGLACMAPFALAAAAAAHPAALPNGCRRVLWICPTKEGREVAVEALQGAGPQGAQSAFLNFYGVLQGVNHQQPLLPRVLELQAGLAIGSGEALAQAMRGHDVVVATPHYFSSPRGAGWQNLTALQALRQITARDGPIFDLHIYDECHYLPTSSWNNIWEALSGPETRYLAMSGTPYRTDNTNIPRDHNTRPFMLLDALLVAQPMVKDVCLLKLRPTAAELEWAGQRTILEQGDEVKCCSVSHPDLVLSRLLEGTADLLRLLRSERGRGSCIAHRALGFVENEAQAHHILRLAEHLGGRLAILEPHGGAAPRRMSVCFLTSEHGTIIDEAGDFIEISYNQVMQRFKRSADLFNPNCIDMVIQHKVLAESFDSPLASVATMFRARGTLVQFAQAVGRVARRITVNVLGIGNVQADNYDNTGHILVHEFSELRGRFDEFCYRQGNRQLVVEADPVLEEEVMQEANQVAIVQEPMQEAPQYIEGFPINAGVLELPAPYDPEAGPNLPNVMPVEGIHARRVVLAPTLPYHNNLLARLDAFHSMLPHQPHIESRIAANFDPQYHP